jgi:hypothetical protein
MGRLWRDNGRTSIEEAWVDDLKGIDVEISIWELNFAKIYAKEKVKGGGDYGRPPTRITRVASALSGSD